MNAFIFVCVYAEVFAVLHANMCIFMGLQIEKGLVILTGLLLNLPK